MATQAGWEDWERLVRLALESKSAISQLYNVLVAHIQDIDAIINDTPRRVAAKEVADIHPTYTVAFLQTARTQFNTLKTWMEANGYGN
jgi:hypothetical protein